MKKSTIITDEEMRKAIDYLRKHSVRGKLGVIQWSPAKGWSSPNLLTAIFTRIKWLFKTRQEQ